MISTQDFVDYPVFGENSSKTAPNSQKYPTGFIQADVLPAEWMNWAWYHNTKGITDLNTGLKITEQELNAVLTAAGITPDEETSGQIRDAIQALIAAKTGTLSDLATTAKTNLVAALNEVVNALSTGLAGKQNTLTFDSTPTSGSSNPVTSSGINTALAAKQNKLTFDTTPTSGSSNPVTSGGINTALATKQNALTFDTTPTSDSSNPVTSGGVYTALNKHMYYIKTFNSPSNVMTYHTISSNDTFGNIALDFNYDGSYIFCHGNGYKITYGSYGSVSYAWSSDNKTLYLRVQGYRGYTIKALGGNVSPDITISDASKTAPSGVTFSSIFTDSVAYKSDLTTAVAALPQSASGAGDTFTITFDRSRAANSVLINAYQGASVQCTYICRYIGGYFNLQKLTNTGMTMSFDNIPTSTIPTAVVKVSETSNTTYWTALYY